MRATRNPSLREEDQQSQSSVHSADSVLSTHSLPGTSLVAGVQSIDRIPTITVTNSSLQLIMDGTLAGGVSQVTPERTSEFRRSDISQYLSTGRPPNLDQQGSNRNGAAAFSPQESSSRMDQADTSRADQAQVPRPSAREYLEGEVVEVRRFFLGLESGQPQWSSC